jgi:hypothetical protein
MSPCSLMGLWSGRYSRRFHDVVARRFSRMALAEQGHGMGFGLGVYSHFGLEVDAHAHDIFGGVEVGGGGGSGGFETYLERAQTIHVDCLGIGKGVGENLLELTEHGDDVGVLGGTVVLNQVGHVLGLHRVDVERTSIPFTLVGTILAVVLAKFVKYWHN